MLLPAIPSGAKRTKSRLKQTGKLIAADSLLYAERRTALQDNICPDIPHGHTLDSEGGGRMIWAQADGMLKAYLLQAERNPSGNEKESDRFSKGLLSEAKRSLTASQKRSFHILKGPI